MEENKISGIIIEICFDVHNTLGPGLLESMYEEIICYELKDHGLFYERQKLHPVMWKNLKMNIGFRTDIIVEKKVIAEIKSIETVAPVHSKILLTYLKLTHIKLGLRLNFNVPLMKDGITRLVNKL